MKTSRRHFLTLSAAAAGLSLIPAWTRAFAEDKPLPFKVSLAEWSLHKAIFGKKIDHLDFAKTAKEQFDISAVEYVNQFFKDKAKDETYLGEMKKRCDDLGVRSLLIMVDGEGALGHADEAERNKVVDNHKKWVDAAAFLGCHSIRVNAQSSGTYDEQAERAADGLAKLTEYAEKQQLSVIVENHGGLSSNAEWLVKVMKLVNHPHCGTLPDFGNFRIKEGEEYDRYKGVEELMPFAHAVSAKTYDFNDKGDETKIDYRKMMKIVYDAGYRGYVGIEYEGGRLDELEGIRASKKLLDSIRDEMLKV